MTPLNNQVKTLDEAIAYAKNHDYKQIALKDGQANIILGFNSMAPNAREDKIKEIRHYLKDRSTPDGYYFISIRKSPRSDTSVEQCIAKRGYGNTANNFYSNGHNFFNSSMPEIEQLRLRNAELEARLQDLEEDNGIAEKDPLMSLAEEHLPALMELGKMWLTQKFTQKPEPKQKKIITVEEILSMPESKEKILLIDLMRTKSPQIYKKYFS
jgi:hypothetical protein